MSTRRGGVNAGTVVVIGLILVTAYSLRDRIGVTDLLIFAVAVPWIILHEVAHGLAALSFGDDTARQAGRLTLNPVRHVDPLGTLVLPGILALTGLGVFGYAKPVPVNPARMRSPRNHSLLVSLAGPATNLTLAAAAVLVLRLARPASTGGLIRLVNEGAGISILGPTDRVLFLLGFVNVTLAVFNALPIPPLDGSAVVARLLPPRALPAWHTYTRYAMPVLLVLVLFDPAASLGHVLGPAERAFARLA